MTSITSRSPGVLAKQITTLDVISGGRAVLGVTAGTAGPPKERSGRLGEAARIFRALLANNGAPGEEVSFEGRYYQLRGAPNRPRPVQQPGLPLLIDVHDDQALKLAAENADACNLTSDLPDLKRSLAILDRHLAGPRPRPGHPHDHRSHRD